MRGGLRRLFERLGVDGGKEGCFACIVEQEMIGEAVC